MSMIRSLYKFSMGVIASFTMAGIASAVTLDVAGPADIPDWTTIPGANAVTPSNILSTNGTFRYRVKRDGSTVMTYRASGSRATVSLEDALGPSTLIDKGMVVVRNGTITVRGVDPLGDNPNRRETLVTAKYIDDASAFYFAKRGDPLDQGNGGPATVSYDLFGINTFDIACISTWTFCTTNESFYVAGNFETNPDRILVRNDATAVTTIPVPAAVWLFGSGLLGLVFAARRKKTA